nr:phosphoribosylamine--glycine ligase [Actinomycetota bacterium]
GVSADGEGRLVTAGGRVLDVIGRGPDAAAARARAYEGARCISWPGLHKRYDIALHAAKT